MKLKDAAKLLNGDLEGDGEAEVINIAKIETAGPDEISFIANPLYERFFNSANAGAVIVSRKFKLPQDNINSRKIPLIRVDDPYFAFVHLLDIFSPKTELQKIGIHASAVVDDSAIISDSEVSIGANCFIGENVKIGNRATILPNCVLLTGVEMGDDVIIYSNVTIYHGCKIGSRVIIHSGTVIGSDGFGILKNTDGSYQKIPQRGIVLIEDDVEIGSNCSIDRAAMGETIIHKGVKLDNQLQIAHNVEIGENTVIAAHTGIAGSTKIGKNCMIGGKVGITGHIEICDGVIITAATNVSKSITRPGLYSGYRAKPQMDELRQEAALRNLRKKK